MPSEVFLSLVQFYEDHSDPWRAAKLAYGIMVHCTDIYTDAPRRLELNAKARSIARAIPEEAVSTKQKLLLDYALSNLRHEVRLLPLEGSVRERNTLLIQYAGHPCSRRQVTAGRSQRQSIIFTIKLFIRRKRLEYLTINNVKVIKIM